MNEFIRITSVENPLVLAVSPMTEFLWPEFIRESRAQVRYAKENCGIKDLSRFGKEIFEHLYMGGDVKPLVSFDDMETYFRERQDGNDPPLPKNFKPEGTFWVQLFNDIIMSPGYDQMMMAGFGDQFSAGNSAVHILNRLSMMLLSRKEEQINQLSNALNNMTQELQDLRDQYVQAKEQGDDAKAAEIRQRGKEISEKLQQDCEQNYEHIKHHVPQAMQEAADAAKDSLNALSTLAGLDTDAGKSTDIGRRMKLVQKIKCNPGLNRVINRLGGIRKAWTRRKRAKKATAEFSDIVGAKFTNNLMAAFPQEMALAASEEGRALFAMKYSQQSLLTKDFECTSKHVDRGPVILYVDISGSMSGPRADWSKAIALCIAEECLDQGREVMINLFNSRIERELTLKPHDRDLSALLDFVARWQSDGGTSFSSVLNHARRIPIDNRADMMVITDGNAPIDEHYMHLFNAWKDKATIECHSFQIDQKNGETEALQQFSDKTYLIDCYDDDASIEAISNIVI